MNIHEIINTSILEILLENNQISDNEEVQQYIDIISIDPEKYKKYIDILKSKYNIDFYHYYKDNIYLNNIDLNNIRKKNEFLNFDNYIKYAKLIFNKRNIPQPHNIDKTIDSSIVQKIADYFGFKLKIKEYTGNGNYASFDLINTITVPEKVDVNTLIHEIGHFFDHKYSNDYKGLAKTITHASSPYRIDKNNEVFAENFLHYFIAPNLLKKYLPEVYNELNQKIPNKFKSILNNLIK